MTELHQMSTLLRRQNDFWQKKMRRRVKMMTFPKLKISQNTEHSPLKAFSLLEQSFLVFWFLIWRIRPQFQRILVPNPHQTKCIALSATRSTNEEASLLLQKTQFLCRILKFPPIQSDQWKNPKVQVFRTFLDTYFNSTIHCLWYFPCSATKNADIFSLVYSLWHFWNFPCETVGEHQDFWMLHIFDPIFNAGLFRYLPTALGCPASHCTAGRPSEQRNWGAPFSLAFLELPSLFINIGVLNFCLRNDKKQRSSQGYAVCGFAPDRMGVKSKSWKLKPFMFISFGRLPSLMSVRKDISYLYIVALIYHMSLFFVEHNIQNVTWWCWCHWWQVQQSLESRLQGRKIQVQTLGTWKIWRNTNMCVTFFLLGNWIRGVNFSKTSWYLYCSLFVVVMTSFSPARAIVIHILGWQAPRRSRLSLS